MGVQKRERQKAMRQAKRDEAARAASREVWQQRILLLVVLAALVGGAVFILTRATADDPAASAEDEFTPSTVPTTLADAVELTPPAPGSTIDGPTPCPAEDGSSERTTTFSEPPPMCIDTNTTYSALVSTDHGDVTIELDPSIAPNTVNNFIVLARYGYYDDVPFHRIIPGFVVQGGDAVGPELGIGGPGYAFDDELPEPGTYQLGSVAMANSGPNTNGSQFFIVSGDAGAGLPPQYSLFGQVSSGLDVVSVLDQLGTQGTGTPVESIVINSVTITEG